MSPAKSAFAQTARPVSVEAAYQVLHIPDETFPAGWNAAVSVPVRAAWSVAGEVGMAHDNRNVPAASTSMNFWNFGVGPRWSSPQGGAAVIYGQLLAGGVHSSADVTLFGVRQNASDTVFMLQPGVGVIVPLSGRFGVLAGFDYRRAFFDPVSENEFRGVFGVRLNTR
jgi:hypothetical protein